VLGCIHTSPVKRVLKVPSDEAADREADLSDAEVATTHQRHRALDAPRHQRGLRRLAVGEAELAAGRTRARSGGCERAHHLLRDLAQEVVAAAGLLVTCAIM
jgi:hypothetical protein